ncbi:hypothetical protein NA56DRAFT_709783 [Hyaloscypha hepaticicola]|uniref:Uncharacterized protein n=1 Tax=Hyaloscypha hepaticicola TaxID=2082293 RepID=A0A2J6PNP8_9HELO|nr:hypothetical protein NA56DRAFT_709783 [Hyaloscypha hepaticicola]
MGVFTGILIPASLDTDDPRKEMDKAWEHLTKGRYFSITEDEVRSTWGENHNVFNYFKWGYRAGIDVLHTLHSLLAKFLDRA